MAVWELWELWSPALLQEELSSGYLSHCLSPQSAKDVLQNSTCLAANLASEQEAQVRSWVLCCSASCQMRLSILFSYTGCNCSSLRKHFLEQPKTRYKQSGDGRAEESSLLSAAGCVSGLHTTVNLTLVSSISMEHHLIEYQLITKLPVLK